MNDLGSERSHTSSPAVLGALLYIAARTADLLNRGEVKEPSGIGQGDREILAEVEATLSTQLPDDPKSMKKTLTEVASAVRFVRSFKEPLSLTAAKYDAHRVQVLEHIGATSTKGATVWPPTSQTAVHRFGSWNEALKAAGLATNKVGRAKGQLRFDAGAYDKAIAGFTADCEERGVGATYKAYGEYAAEHKGEVPSAAAVRKFYGSWNKALASAS